MLWPPTASSSQHGARVLTDVKARRFTPPRLRGADRLDCAEHVRGIVTATWALSGEISQDCGGPEDPVTLSRGGRGTQCGHCRKPGNRVLPRPAWRREHETGHEAPGLLKDFIGTQDLADLIGARHTLATHAGWRIRRGQGDPRHEDHLPDGWNRLEPSPAPGESRCPLSARGSRRPGGPPASRSGSADASSTTATHAVLRGERDHAERRQRDDGHLLRPSRPHAKTGLDAPGVRPMLDPRTAEPRAGESEPRTDRGSGQGSCAASASVTIAIST